MGTKITAALVKELREKTGVGMMDCKKALVEADGDIEVAIANLRKAGQAKAIKKGSRVAAEGIISIAQAADKKAALIIEINCETDFVARQSAFQEFVAATTKGALERDLTTLEKLAPSVEEVRLELVSQLGENIAIRRMQKLSVEQGTVGAYLHGSDAVTKIGAVVCLDKDDAELAQSLAMQIAAMRPEYLDESQIPAERVEKERSIFATQAQEEAVGKPPEIVEKIAEGKLKKYLRDLTLLGQTYIKDNKTTIKQLLADQKAKITQYVRFEVGEGIEKKADDFYSEVMSQVEGS